MFFARPTAQCRYRTRLALVLFITVRTVTAATHYVSPAGGHVSPFTSWADAATNIHFAVNVAVSNDIVRIAAGTYSHYQLIVIGAGIRVQGTNRNAIIVDGLGNHRVFALHGGAILESLTVTNGDEFTVGGVGCASASDLVSNCLITGNVAENNAGGTWGGTIADCLISGNNGGWGGGACSGTIIRCTLSGNAADDHGGGAYHCALTGCTVTGNSTSGKGDGLYQCSADDCVVSNNSGSGAYECEVLNSTLTGNAGRGATDCMVSNCMITGNTGGGIDGGTALDCTITGNMAVRGAGAWGAELWRCTLSSNAASDRGGGAADSMVSNCAITGNSANNGGGASVGSAFNCIISSNYATNQGGGTWGTWVENSVISNNAAARGGGVYGARAVNCLVVTNRAGVEGGGMWGGIMVACTVTDNSAGNRGGGIYGGICGPSYCASVSNSVFIGNWAGTNGGGVYNVNADNCTISRNSARQGGGAYSSKLNNCIVYYNSATVSQNDIYGTSQTLYGCSRDLSPLPAYYGNITDAPMFVSIASGNLHVRPSSPCINSGTNLTWTSGDTDRDGNPRVIEYRVDMGAYEAHSTPAADMFADAQMLPNFDALAYAANTNATTEPGEPPHAGAGPYHSVWWNWQAPHSVPFAAGLDADGDIVHIDTLGSDFDTVLAVYTGTAVNALGPAVAANDDAQPDEIGSAVAFEFGPGTVYRIVVDGKTTEDVGDLELHYYVIPEGCIAVVLALAVAVGARYWNGEFRC